MIKIEIPCESGKVSDGYHTFDELYEHRCLLFLNLMAAHPECSWYSKQHDDGSEMEGWFVAGIEDTITGPVTYHLPDRMMDLAAKVGACHMNKAPKWDGHTSPDVLVRLKNRLD